MAVRTAGARHFQRQLDAAFPDRDGPDGWIGDAAHRARTSGHNPDDTPGSRPAWDGDPDNLAEVRAVDVKRRLGAGVDGQDLVDHLTRLPGLSGVIRYLIHAGRIYHARTGFRPQPHDGAPHDEHVHVEFAWSQAADQNTTFDYRLEEIPMALTAADKQWIAARIDAAAAEAARATLAGLDAAGIRFTEDGVNKGKLRTLGGTMDADARRIIGIEATLADILAVLTARPPA